MEQSNKLLRHATNDALESLSLSLREGVFITTDRLIIKPLTLRQLVMYVKCDQSLERELKVNPSSREMSAELAAAFEQTIFPNVADETKNYLYATMWTAILITDKEMVGDICMYGPPDEAGEVEIGYGTHDKFQNKGLMTEIVGGMLSWLALQPEVRSVRAATEPANLASSRVLERNGFVKTAATESLCHWRLLLNK